MYILGIDFSEPDLFDLFRLLLGVVVTIYCVIVTGQSVWTWYVWLSSPDRHMSLLRRYLLVQFLRMRLRRFGGELLVCALLTVTFLLLLHAQSVLGDIERTLAHVPRP